MGSENCHDKCTWYYPVLVLVLEQIESNTNKKNHHNQAEPALLLYLINTLLRSWVLVHVLVLLFPS